MNHAEEEDTLESEAPVGPPTPGPTPEELAEEWRDKYLRTLAELDNYRKRSDREREAARRYALEGLMRDLLPLLDGLEAALGAQGDLASIQDGIRLVLQTSLRVLTDRGLEAIPAVGQMFDPRIHEAAGVAIDAKLAPGTIIREDRPGYRLHDRILRPSAVHIVVAPQPKEENGGVEPREAAPPGDDVEE